MHGCNSAALQQSDVAMLGVVSLAQFLGMTLWFSATAVTPLLIDEFNIRGRMPRG